MESNLIVCIEKENACDMWRLQYSNALDVEYADDFSKNLVCPTTSRDFRFLRLEYIDEECVFLEKAKGNPSNMSNGLYNYWAEWGSISKCESWYYLSDLVRNFKGKKLNKLDEVVYFSLSSYFKNIKDLANYRVIFWLTD